MHLNAFSNRHHIHHYLWVIHSLLATFLEIHNHVMLTVSFIPVNDNTNVQGFYMGYRECVLT